MRQKLSLESLEDRRLLSFALHVNFQPAGSPVPAGYVADAGASFGSRGNGFSYGWDGANTGGLRDRNKLADQRYDTLNHTQAYGSHKWELAVPNGEYTVHVVAGDPGYTDSVYKFNVENVLTVSGTPTSSNHFIGGTRTVTVSDGRLTISNASGAKNNKLAFVDITSTTNPPPSPPPPPSTLPTIPGRIEAENFDNGGKNVSWFDTTAGNQGGAYRTNTDVDVQANSGGGYAIGRTRPTEWTKYTFNAASSGTYTVAARVASATGGTFHLEFDGVDKTGPLTLPNTGGWQTWKTISKSGISLSAGQHTMRLVFDKQAVSGQDIGNVDWFNFTAGGTVTPPGVSVSATDGSASEAGGNTGTFTLTRTGSTASALTVKYALGGSATNGVDYDALAGSVTIPAGSSSTTVTVTPKDDAVAEGTESVILTLAPSADYTIGTSSAMVSIADNDAATGNTITWTTGAASPVSRSEAMTATIDGKMYVLGGYTNSTFTPTTRVDVYDPAANTWTRLSDSDMPVATSHSGCTVVGRNIVLAGGYPRGASGSGQTFSTAGVWSFNVDTHAWTTLPNLPAARGGGALVNLDGTLHFFGGADSSRKDANTHWALAPGATSWTTLAPLPTNRNHMGAVVLGGKIYAIGGQQNQDAAELPQAAVEMYDPATNAWTSRASLPFGRSHIAGATVILNGRIVVLGGETSYNTVVNDVVAYDPASNTWSAMTHLPQTRNSGVAAFINGELIYSTGRFATTTYRGTVS